MLGDNILIVGLLGLAVLGHLVTAAALLAIWKIEHAHLEASVAMLRNDVRLLREEVHRAPPRNPLDH